MAQVLPLKKAILVGLEATPSGGPPWIDITDTDAVNTAFVDALTSLPPQGGTLYVMPSDGSPYRFASTVTVSKPNVSIEFLGGSEIAFATGSSGPQTAFLVTAPNFKCRGARGVFEVTSANNTPGRSFFRIEADEAELTDCTFELKQNVPSDTTLDSFACIRLFTDPLSGLIRQNLKVARCSFIVQPGIQQAFGWTPVVGEPSIPRGICGIVANRLRGCILTENAFRSASSTLRGDSGPVIYLLDVEECTISSSTFRGLRIPNSKPPSGDTRDRGSLIRLTGFTIEGHHTVFSANVIDDVDTGHVMMLDNVRYDFISANVIDRVGPNCFTVVRATAGNVLGITGNSITRISGPVAGMTDAEGVFHFEAMDQVLLAGNVLSDITTGRTLIDIPPGTSANVVVSPAQSRSNVL